MKFDRMARFVIIPFFLCTLLIVGVVFSYFHNFGNYESSNDPAVWGQFGDYFAGIINPIVGIFNLVFFIFISFLLQRFNDQNNQISINASRNIALMQMRREELHYLKTEMDRDIDFWKKNPSNKKVSKELKEKFEEMQSRLSYLFPEIISSEWSQNLITHFASLLDKEEFNPSYIKIKTIETNYSNLINLLSRKVIEQKF